MLSSETPSIRSFLSTAMSVMLPEGNPNGPIITGWSVPVSRR
jgi:hypothetical protein